jgi:hypothetical protein
MDLLNCWSKEREHRLILDIHVCFHYRAYLECHIWAELLAGIKNCIKVSLKGFEELLCQETGNAPIRKCDYVMGESVFRVLSLSIFKDRRCLL